MTKMQNAGFRIPVMLLALCGTASAQQAEVPQVYEVATIRPSPLSAPAGAYLWSAVRFSARGQTLRELIKTAYEIRMDGQLIGTPEWAEAERFDVEAKMTAAQAERFEKVPLGDRLYQYQLMLRGLLEERFDLKLRQEKRELSVNALSVAKGGSRLKEVEGLKMEHGRVPPPPPPGSVIPSGLKMPGLKITRGHFAGTALPISSLVSWIAGQPETNGRVVVDQTGLMGTYDIDLRWSPEDASGSSSADSQQSEPGLTSALREQLGLQLIPAKAVVPVVVVEHASRPSEN